MRILITNDDGVYAPGIHALAQAVSKMGQVVIVAPDRNRSGASNSLTLDVPIHVKTIEGGAVSVEGTPTDCVHLAVTGLLEHQPNIVLSGINKGANLGDDVLYSGTVAAATEGRYLGLPAIAVSLVGNHECKHYDTAGIVVRQLLKKLVADPLPASTILNVNVPDLPLAEIQGYEVTRLGTRHQAEPTIMQRDPRGQTVYWVGPPGPKQDAGEGTDFNAIAHGKVSITPLQVDLTHYKVFDQLSQWLSGL